MYGLHNLSLRALPPARSGLPTGAKPPLCDPFRTHRNRAFGGGKHTNAASDRSAPWHPILAGIDLTARTTEGNVSFTETQTVRLLNAQVYSIMCCTISGGSLYSPGLVALLERHYFEATDIDSVTVKLKPGLKFFLLFKESVSNMHP